MAFIHVPFNFHVSQDLRTSVEGNGIFLECAYLEDVFYGVVGHCQGEALADPAFSFGINSRVRVGKPLKSSIDILLENGKIHCCMHGNAWCANDIQLLVNVGQW